MPETALKREIRDAILKGDTDTGQGWTLSNSTYPNTPSCIAVFTKSFRHINNTVTGATIVLRLEPNGDIRCYPSLRFSHAPSDNWRTDFFNRYEAKKTDGIHLSQAEYKPSNQTGIAINATLLGYTWQNWRQSFPKDALSKLRVCCQKLCEWTDDYVSTLP